MESPRTCTEVAGPAAAGRAQDPPLHGLSFAIFVRFSYGSRLAGNGRPD